MNCFEEIIWEDGEYSYRGAYGFCPNIHAYLHEDSENRDCMIVVPGGGYCMCVPCEARIPAIEFYEKGMNVFVMTYTTDITTSIPLKKQPLSDITRAVRFIRKREEEYHISDKKIIICGFSAGAHVCGSLAVHFDDVKDENTKYANVSCRPDGVILSYPVITTGEKTHRDSVTTLLGHDASVDELDYFSLEKQVKENRPPCFIWQTADDGLVPVENSYLFAEALLKKGIYFAHYVFPSGFHGLSVPNRDFFEGKFEDYTMRQVNMAVKAVLAGEGIDVSPERVEELRIQFAPGNEGDPPKMDNPEEMFSDVRNWPNLAIKWMERI